jgi:hypothetical protein
MRRSSIPSKSPVQGSLARLSCRGLAGAAFVSCATAGGAQKITAAREAAAQQAL